MKPIATVPHALRTVDVATGEAAGRSTSAPTSAPCRPPASSPRRWSRSCSPRRCWRSSAATRSPRPGATSTATSSTALAYRADRRLGTASDAPARWCWSGRPAPARRTSAGAPGRARSASPFVDTDNDVEAAAGTHRSPTIFARTGEAHFRALERAARRRARCTDSTACSRSAAERCCAERPARDLAGAPVGLPDRGLADAARAGRRRHRTGRCWSATRRATGRDWREARRRCTSRSPTSGVDTDGRVHDEVADEIAGRRLTRDGDVTEPIADLGMSATTAHRASAAAAPYRRAGRRTACSASSRRCWTALPGSPSSTRRRCAPTAAAVRSDLRGRRATRRIVLEVPDAEAAKTLEVAARSAGTCSGQADFTRTDAVVGLGGGATTDLAGFVAATWLRGRARGPGADDAARHGRRRGRRQDRHQHRRGQEPGRRVPPAGRRALRPRPRSRRCPRDDYRRRAGRGRQVRLHRRPGDPRPHRGRPGRGRRPARRRARGARRAGDRGQGRRRRRGPHRAGPARDPQLRPHPRPRDRAAPSATAGGTARRSRSAWSSPPSWRASPGGSTTRPPTGTARILDRARPAGDATAPTPGRSCSRDAASTRRPAATGCASSCSTASASPAMLDGPGPDAAGRGSRGGARDASEGSAPRSPTASRRVLVAQRARTSAGSAPASPTSTASTHLRRPGRAVRGDAGVELGLDVDGAADRRRGAS